MRRDPTPTTASVPEVLEDDQTLVDREQNLADADQTGSERDQTAAGREQAAADSDQAASDRDLVHGGDPEVHDSSRAVRNRSAQQRQYSAQGRVEAADARDQVALARDLTALARDQAAVDRKQAARDRLQAQADRDALLRELAIAKTDGLTGTRSRATGLEDFDHEIDRAHRTMAPLVIAYIEIVGLKAVNDTQGHAAGDALLQRAVTAIRGHLRSYDLIVRIGGDEFLSVMSGATIKDARQRFVAIETALAVDAEQCEIKVGFAALEADDSAAELIKRADAELPTSSRR